MKTVIVPSKHNTAIYDVNLPPFVRISFVTISSTKLPTQNIAHYSLHTTYPKNITGRLTVVKNWMRTIISELSYCKTPRHKHASREHTTLLPSQRTKDWPLTEIAQNTHLSSMRGH